MNNPLDLVLTVSECSERYRVDSHTVAVAIRNGRLVEGRDCRKSSGVWLIADKAAQGLWGYRLHDDAPEGSRRCRKCGAVYPATTEYFRTYRTKKYSGLTRICVHCYRLQNAGWRDRNRARRRIQSRENSRRFRAANPGYGTRQNKRYRLRKKLEQSMGQS